MFQKIAPHNAARWLRRTTKKWQRNSPLIQRRATEFARSRGFRYVTCGHTHLPLVARSEDGITYINSGTWTDHAPCPFVAVKDDRVWLDHWPLAEPQSSVELREAPEETEEELEPEREGRRFRGFRLPETIGAGFAH